jgi:hypothetical protein
MMVVLVSSESLFSWLFFYIHVAVVELLRMLEPLHVSIHNQGTSTLIRYHMSYVGAPIAFI